MNISIICTAQSQALLLSLPVLPHHLALCSASIAALIACTSACIRCSGKIPAQRVLDFFFARLRITVQQRLYGDHKTRCAKTALRSAPIAICFLDRRQRAVIGNPFHGRDVWPVVFIWPRSSWPAWCSSAPGRHPPAPYMPRTTNRHNRALIP